MTYYEDMDIGARRDLGSYTFTPELIKKFAAEFDPQPFHLDEEAGRKSMFGGLAASGWHVAAACMKLTVGYFQRAAAERVASGQAPIVSGPSPGFKELKWLKPVLAGDTVTYTSEVVAKRETASKPYWGIVNLVNSGVNQRGEKVFSFVATAFIARKPK